MVTTTKAPHAPAAPARRSLPPPAPCPRASVRLRGRPAPRRPAAPPLLTLLLSLLLCVLALSPAPARATAAVELAVTVNGLDKRLAGTVAAALREEVALLIDVIDVVDAAAQPDGDADPADAAGARPQYRLVVRYEGAASAGKVYTAAITGPVVEKRFFGGGDPIPTGKAGRERYYFSRFTAGGRLSYSLEKRDEQSGAYRAVDSWARTLRKATEEQTLGSELEVQGEPGVAQATFPGGSLAEQFESWLLARVGPAASAGLREHWFPCRLTGLRTAGRHRARGKVTITNRSPWPVDDVAVDVAAYAAIRGGSAAGIETVEWSASAESGPLEPGEKKAVAFEAEPPAGLEPLPADHPAAARAPKRGKPSYRVALREVTWRVED